METDETNIRYSYNWRHLVLNTLEVFDNEI